MVLDWLLKEGLRRQRFSLREAAKEINVSLGLVQRVFGILVTKGILQTEGIRTAKTFCFIKPKALLESWLQHYNLTNKCKMRTYRSSFSDKASLLNALKKSHLSEKVALALHSAAEAHGYKNTNLNTLELYLLDPTFRPQLEKVLELEPQERGYEVLLIEPYYKSLVNASEDKPIKVSPILLTYLDLYHFPLRGQEQAEFMAQRIPDLKQIYKKG